MRQKLFLFLLFPLCSIAQDISLYRLSTIGYADGRNLRFVTLTDNYRYSEHPDSVVIADKFVGDAEINEKTDNFHELAPIYRNRFLERMQIDESDNIYIYFFGLDSVFVFPVVDVPLIAFLTPYGTYHPISQSEYMIGFEVGENLISKTDIGEDSYYNSLVFVGPSSPFITGNVKAIVWNETDASEFPESNLEPEALQRYGVPDTLHTYSYLSGEFKFYLQDLGTKSGLGARHLSVVQKEDDEIILERVYYDSEGSYLHPLNGTHSEYGPFTYQYTGLLLRFKPRIVVGFLGFSFGCSSIDFVSKTEEPIYIKCDNRH